MRSSRRAWTRSTLRQAEDRAQPLGERPHRQRPRGESDGVVAEVRPAVCEHDDDAASTVSGEESLHPSNLSAGGRMLRQPDHDGIMGRIKDMDTLIAGDIAQKIGVSLPTVHLILDAEGVPRAGRGRVRVIPPGVADRIVAEREVGQSREGTLIIRALRSAPVGISSFRSIARAAGVSPTTVSRLIPKLVSSGAVRAVDRRVPLAGKVVRETFYVAETIPTTRATERRASAGSPTRIPRDFWHLFWNARPSALRLPEDEHYVARRMLRSGSFAAMQWALLNTSEAGLRDAVAGRGVDSATRAMVENWLA